MSDIKITLNVSHEMNNILESLAKTRGWTKAEVIKYGIAMLVSAEEAWKAGKRVAIVPGTDSWTENEIQSILP